MTRPHTTHHESCGCCEAERDALKAQVERLRAMYAAVLDAADAMRDWTPVSYVPGLLPEPIEALRVEACATYDAARAASPAQSLAAHDAEVRAQALREAAQAAKEWSWDGRLPLAAQLRDEVYAHILALAERAPEVER